MLFNNSFSRESENREKGPANNGISLLLFHYQKTVTHCIFTIHTAENGNVAWELFQQQSYDLLLIDLEMPLMDGKQLLAKIRDINKDIPAIAFTAAVYENMYDDLHQHGFNSYLHKPFRPVEMHRNILQHLE